MPTSSPRQHGYFRLAATNIASAEACTSRILPRQQQLECLEPHIYATSWLYFICAFYKIIAMSDMLRSRVDTPGHFLYFSFLSADKGGVVTAS